MDLDTIFLPEQVDLKALVCTVLGFECMGIRHPMCSWMTILDLMAATIQRVKLVNLSMQVVQWIVIIVDPLILAQPTGFGYSGKPCTSSLQTMDSGL